MLIPQTLLSSVCVWEHGWRGGGDGLECRCCVTHEGEDMQQGGQQRVLLLCDALVEGCEAVGQKLLYATGAGVQGDWRQRWGAGGFTQ